MKISISTTSKDWQTLKTYWCNSSFCRSLQNRSQCVPLKITCRIDDAGLWLNTMLLRQSHTDQNIALLQSIVFFSMWSSFVGFPNPVIWLILEGLSMWKAKKMVLHIFLARQLSKKMCWILLFWLKNTLQTSLTPSFRWVIFCEDYPPPSVTTIRKL